MTGKKKLVPPDGGWGWVVVLGGSLINLATRPIEPSFGLLFGDLLNDLEIATTGAGVIVSTYEAMINFSGLFVGPLIKNFSFRKIAFLGSVLTGLGLIATYPAASMAHIIVTYSIINGLGIGFSSSATFVALNHYFKKKRGRAVGITMVGTGLGLLLMPQAVRYLTQEYDFTGSILILGAFALNACVGSVLLQPVKWHLKEERADEEKMVPPVSQNGDAVVGKKLSACPQITITNTIAENDEDEDADAPMTPPDTDSYLEMKDEPTPTRRLSERPRFYFKIDRKYSLIDRDSKQEFFYSTNDQNGQQYSLNKSSTEPKFEKYFEESRRKMSECPSKLKNTSTFSINNKQEFNSTANIRKRKGSTISNLSNVDFTGSCVCLPAIKNDINDLKSEVIAANNNKEQSKNIQTDKKPEGTLWQRFSNFMDLDLLKDLTYLNILFGLSIFYVAELNFKMVVPFFLADFGHSKSEIAICLSVMAASDIVARVLLPPLCDKIKITRRTMFMIGAIFLAISRSALGECGTATQTQLEIILVISGFFRGATLINFMLVISEYCDSNMDKLPAAFGLHMVAKGIFIVAFGPLIGLIRDVTQSFPICIHSQSLLIMLCILAWGIEYATVVIRQRQKCKVEENNT